MPREPLADLLALAMVGVACFHSTRLALAALWRRRTEVDVDIVHTVMGVSMAGMLTGWLNGGWNDAWMLAFAAATVWFGRGVVRDLSDVRAGTAVSHHLPHFVASAVMLYMLWAVRWSAMGPHMGSTGHVGGSLLLSSVVAVLVVGNAAIAAFGALTSLSRATAVAGAVATGPSSSRPASPGAPSRPIGVLAPRGAPACLLVMSVAMAYMVVTVHP